MRIEPDRDPRAVADNIKRWKYLQAYTSDDMEEILIAKLIAASARQIAVFPMILALVSVAIVALIIYNMTLAKIKEIAVLKLIGTKNITIAGMILQEAPGLGLIGFEIDKPPIILADEPTAPLDSARALTVARILNRLAREYRTAIIVVTHNGKIIPTFKRIYQIRDGRTEEQRGEGRDLG